MHHILDGYYFLKEKGFEDAARICITHSFPIKDVQSAAGKWDCTNQKLAFVKEYLSNLEYGEYDRLIQLCDAIALPTGFSLIEKRLMDVALRRGVKEYSVLRWKVYLELKQDFEQIIGLPIYKILPGVIENIFKSNLLAF